MWKEVVSMSADLFTILAAVGLTIPGEWLRRGNEQDTPALQ